MNNKKVDVQRLTVLAMLTALAYASVWFSSIIFPVKIQGMLSLEPKDCILAIGAFLYGPTAGVLVSVVVSLLEYVTFSTTGWIGLVMNILSSVMFICPAAWIYKRRHTLQGALIGLITGTLLMTAGMLLWNYLITPLYMEVERSMVVAMLIPVFLPFNLLKGGMNAALTMVLYKAVAQMLRKSKLLPPSGAVSQPVNKKKSVGIWICALLIAVTLIVTGLVWAGIL